MSREKLRALDRCKADNLYRKGQVVFQEGTPPLGVYCVYEGQLKMFKAGSQGRSQIIGIAKSGTLMGHRALLTKKPHSFTAESLGEARVCFVEQKIFLTLLSENPAVAESLLRKMAVDLDLVEDRLIDIVEKQRTGLCVDPENVDAIAEGMRRLLFDDAFRAECAANALRLANEKYCYEVEGQPFVDRLISFAKGEN